MVIHHNPEATWASVQSPEFAQLAPLIMNSPTLGGIGAEDVATMSRHRADTRLTINFQAPPTVSEAKGREVSPPSGQATLPSSQCQLFWKM